MLARMGVFDAVDRVLDRMDRFDDRVRDRLPAGWVKASPPTRPTADDERRRADLTDAGILMLRILVPAFFFAGRLVLRGEWWTALLGAVVAFVAVSVVLVLDREVWRRT